MIGFLRGKVVQILPSLCLLDVNGVGYRVFISDTARQSLRLNEEGFLYTHMSVREDAIQLYGFASQAEYDLFELLISVSGIGPKVAIGILSAISVDGLCRAIQGKQLKVLTRLPGIGKKSAERLILELKDKIASPEFASGEEADNVAEEPVADDVQSQAVEALHTFGYTNAEIMPVLKRAKEDLDVAALIKFALRELAGRN